ncbi:SMI1/KNR4 family protein [Lignipirellula cremea]|uniref:SMI1/KNR4 family protein n=1 Tax=Lignipirellula cremea TaxID=2528010 RepID=UPI00119E3B47|nr:SMI1/KNR4 family protein [Lignipirellula cremea]
MKVLKRHSPKQSIVQKTPVSAPRPPNSPGPAECAFAVRRLKLPKSFCEYALTFGPGELAGFFTIATPTRTACDFELEKFDRDLHGPSEERLLERFGSDSEMKEFLFFCSTGGGDFFGWKLDSQTEPRTSEYEIHRFSAQLSKVAETFSSFVHEYVFSPSKDRNWKPDKTFAPIQIER